MSAKNNLGRAKTWQVTNVPNLYLHKGGGYYYRVKVDGKQIWQSLHTKLKGVAESRIAEKQKVVRASRKVAEGAKIGKLTTGQALAGVLTDIEASPDIKPNTKRFRREGVKALLASWPELEKLNPRKLTEHEVKEWSVRVRTTTPNHVPHNAVSAMRNAKGCSTSKHNGMLDVLRLALDFAVKHGAAFSNVARGQSIKRPSQKPKQLTLPNRADFPRLVTAMRGIGGNAKHAANLVELLAYSGARINEAKNLFWRDVDFDRNQINLRETKNGDPRPVAMMAELRALLLAMKEEQPGANKDDAVAQVFEAQKSLDSAAKRAGVPRMTHHDLRHLFATTCIESGMDIPTVARLLGHKDGGALAMKTYGHLRDEHAQRMMLRVSYRSEAA